MVEVVRFYSPNADPLGPMLLNLAQERRVACPSSDETEPPSLCRLQQITTSSRTHDGQHAHGGKPCVASRVLEESPSAHDYLASTDAERRHTEAPEQVIPPPALFQAEGATWHPSARMPRGWPCPLIGAVISDRYEISEYLGCGSFGLGFEAVDRSSRSRVFVKIPRPDLAKTTLEQEVRDELETVRALSAAAVTHPNLSPLLDVTGKDAPAAFVLGGRPVSRAHVIVTELAGMDLYWALSLSMACGKRKFTSFSEPLARYFLRQLVSAMEFLHSCGLFHLDIKAENVLVVVEHDGQFRLKLTDFGRMVRAGQPVARCAEPYEPPERRDGGLQHVMDGSKVDVWQTAVVLIYMLAASEHKIWRRHAMNGLAPICGLSPIESWARRLVLGGSSMQLSVGAMDLLAAMLAAVPESRPSMSDIAAHAWLREPDTTTEDIAAQMLGRGLQRKKASHGKST